MGGRHVSLALVLSFGSLIYCKPSPPVEAPIVVVYPLEDGGYDAEAPEVSAECYAACENLTRLGCPESLTTGRTCGSVCTISNALKFDTRPWCVSQAGTAEQVRECCKPGERCARTKCRGR